MIIYEGMTDPLKSKKNYFSFFSFFQKIHITLQNMVKRI